MKLNIFNKETVGALPSRTSLHIRMTKKGASSISAAAVVEYGFKEGDTIAFVQDEENPECWYLTRDKNGFELRTYNNSGDRARFNLAWNSSKMAKMMFDALGLDATSYRFMLGEVIKEGKQEYITIITSSATE